VVGFDDLPESEFQVVPLSSIRQDFQAMARTSVEHIVRALEGRPVAQRTVSVQASLVVRASSAPPHDTPGGPPSP
ncbi:LacI family transcriptional regulator, partial [Streptomyces sp. NP160]|uniref:substrate-binding domain-containing protein n=1 Tax=Streptomyces sp. NP160 TaxID=2586637 RepID=UPI00111B3369